MMPEYIESICRSCFHSYVCEQFNRHRDSHNEKCHFYNDHFVPAADVVAVVHGRWLEQEAPNMDTYYDCSACGESFCFIEGSPKDNLYTYCPNCGAKMDGGDAG